MAAVVVIFIVSLAHVPEEKYPLTKVCANRDLFQSLGLLMCVNHCNQRLNS